MPPIGAPDVDLAGCGYERAESVNLGGTGIP
jgi:hypothetical protein